MLNIIGKIKSRLGIKKPIEAKIEQPAKPARNISMLALSQIAGDKKRKPSPYVIQRPAPGVLPKGAAGLANDAQITDMMDYAKTSYIAEGQVFLGYAYLAELSQRTEYRRAVEIIASELTRKWGTVKTTGDEDKTDKIKAIESELTRLDARGKFRQALMYDGFFGRCHVFVDFGESTADDQEMRSELTHNDVKIHGKIEHLKVIDPIWMYPATYSAANPLADDFYRPRSWYVLGRQIHGSRWLEFVTRPVTDILKPAYMFGGLSLTQIMKPYVDNWLNTRQSVSDILQAFTVWGLKTDMSSMLEGGGADEVIARAQAFNDFRNNKGLMVLDKEEEFFNVAAPLGSLDHLQAQAQEHMSAACGIPLIKYLGITPSGLNASSEGEIRSFYDTLHSIQEGCPTKNIQALLEVIQVSLFGEIDPEITWKWEPLWQMDAMQEATIRKTEADTDAVLDGLGAISAEEIRKRLAADENSPYHGLDDVLPVKNENEELEHDNIEQG